MWKRHGKPKKRSHGTRRNRIFDTFRSSSREPANSACCWPPTRRSLRPPITAQLDLDPAIGAGLQFLHCRSSSFKLTADVGRTIEDGTVTASRAVASVGWRRPLVLGNDYTFAYNAATDQITLTSVSPRFVTDTYDLVISPNNQIWDNEDLPMPAKAFQITVTNLTPTNFPTLNPIVPRGSLMFSNTTNVAAQSQTIAGTSFEEPAIAATSYTSVGQEIGWTRTLTNGTPGGNAVYGVRNSATGLGGPAFPPTNGSKAYVSRGNSVQTTETLTFDPVDLTGRSGVSFSIDVFRSNTGFENGDLLSIVLVLSNSTSTTSQPIAELLTGGNVGNSNLLTSGAYRTLTANVGARSPVHAHSTGDYFEHELQSEPPRRSAGIRQYSVSCCIAVRKQRTLCQLLAGCWTAPDGRSHPICQHPPATSGLGSRIDADDGQHAGGRTRHCAELCCRQRRSILGFDLRPR